MAARTWLVGLTASAFLLAGCGGGTPSDPASTPPPASPTAPSTTPRAAADGTDVSACADGTCEVEVRAGTTIPVPAPGGTGNFSVTQITPQGVTFRSELNGGSVQGTAPPGAPVRVGPFVGEVESITGDSAVVSLHPA